MRKLCLLSVVCAIFGLANSATAGNFSDLKSKAGSCEGDAYMCVGGTEVVECDDDSGDAGAKVVALWDYGVSRVESKRCFINPKLTGSDKWIKGEDRPGYCSEPCTAPKHSHTIPGEHNWVVCVDSLRRAKTIGDTVFIEGGSSQHSGCVYKNCPTGQTWDFSSHECKAASTTCSGGSPAGTHETGFLCADYEYSREHFSNAKRCRRRCDENGKWIYAITECEEGYQGKPVAGEPGIYTACEPQPQSNNTGGGNGGGARPSCVVLNKCSLNPNADECRACCTVRPADAVSWNRSTYKCECRDRTKQFDVASATCVAQGAAPTTYECPTETMTEINKWAIDCVAKPEIISLITEIRTYCTSPGRTAVGFSELYERLTALNPQNCEKINNAQQLCSQISDASMVDGECKCNDADKVVDETKKQCVESPEARARREAEEAAARQRTSQAKIVAISTKMETISSALKDASVWKDKEGNFNTARLASDSIAGVVLGTAGGLITSNVVKKNQIKGGFENLSCTIGGQVVASYGDEFSVGINTNAW